MDFRSIKDPIKIFGAHLSYDIDNNNDANFFVKIRNMKIKLNLWQTRDLTFCGKSLLAKTLGASHLIYTASMLSVPDTAMSKAESHLFSFSFVEKQHE